MTALAVLCCAVFATGCRTCKDNHSHKDVPSTEEVRPSSSLRGRWDVEEVLTAEQAQTEAGRRQTSALGAYAKGRYLRERRLTETQEEFSSFAEEDLFAAALRQMPDSAEVLKEVLGPRLVAKDFPGALRLLEPIADQHPDSLALLQTRIDLLVTLHRYAEARKYLEHHLTLPEGRQPAIVSQLADIYLNQGDLDALEALLQKPYPGLHLTQVGLELSLWWGRLEACKARKQKDGRATPEQEQYKRKFDQAVATLSKLSYQTKAEVFFAGRMLANYGLCKPLDDFLKPFAGRTVGSFKDCSDSGEDRKLLLQNSASFHFCRILAAVKSEDKEAIQSAIKRASSPKIPLEERCELPDLLSRSGMLDVALQTACGQLLVEPANLALLQGAARLFAMKDQTDRALMYLESSGRLDAQGMWLRATILESAKCNQKAYDTWQAIVGPGDADEQATNLLRLFESAECEQYLTLCEKLRHSKKAIAVAKALFEQMDTPHNANLYGYMLTDHDVDPAKGLVLIQQALKDTPKEPAYLDSLAWAYYKLKQPLKALQAILDSIANNGLVIDSDGVIAWHAALICEQNSLPLLAKYYCILAAQGPETCTEANLAREHLKK